MAQLYLGLGSNIAPREEYLQKAIQLIEIRVGRVVAVSQFYETKPWGFASPNMFLDAAIQVETNIFPRELLIIIQQIEKEMGRNDRNSYKRYEDRMIDIDILFYDDLVYSDPELTIPHPLIEKREFVLNALCDIAPDFVHPVCNKKVADLVTDLHQNEPKSLKPPFLKYRLNSLSYALTGFRILFKNELNARIHLAVGIGVIVAGIFFRLPTIEWIILILLIGVVFMAEIFNTVIEYFADFISPSFRNQIKNIKDLGAAGVLIVSIAAIIIGLAIFIPKILAN
ncbi:MAG: 2-amino-4-hydroxy-6-hydroxymethyldihydropteridine diphosphokinase [Bacteroidales bacterium]|jgi:2-amino-4-hydroxy-6-hydroxymethyldihydropteridine diphosphokinase|nr:2-amino-4-hydroxy-6-hydroxymethyldihydropteridine diphosphokinase [Bacteroidales bacterium]